MDDFNSGNFLKPTLKTKKNKIKTQQNINNNQPNKQTKNLNPSGCIYMVWFFVFACISSTYG